MLDVAIGLDDAFVFLVAVLLVDGIGLDDAAMPPDAVVLLDSVVLDDFWLDEGIGQCLVKDGTIDVDNDLNLTFFFILSESEYET